MDIRTSLLYSISVGTAIKKIDERLQQDCFTLNKIYHNFLETLNYYSPGANLLKDVFKQALYNS